MSLGVALVKELCPSCLKEMEGPLVLNQILTEKEKKKVEELHLKVVGISDSFCDTCEEYSKQGIILVGVDESRTEDPTNPYRSGAVAVVKEEAFIRIFDCELPEKRMGYILHDVGVNIGLWEK